MRNSIENRFLDIFTTYDGGRVRLPLMIKRSPNPGPTIFLVGVIHGEEVIGIEVIHRVLKSTQLKCGAIHAIPVANMAGFSLGVRTVPYGEPADWSNLNRIFPGYSNGRPDEKIAAGIYKLITQSRPNLVIDIHADSQSSIPFVILDRLVKKASRKLVESTKFFADYFGITVCNDSDFGGYIEDRRDKSLTGALLNYDKTPAFVVELGGPNVIKESFVQIGVAGVKNILFAMNMLDGNWKHWSAESKIKTNYQLRTLTVSTKKYSGKINYKVGAGERINKNQLIASIENVFGKEQEKVFAPADGWVISLGYQAISFPGIPIATLAIKDTR